MTTPTSHDTAGTPPPYPMPRTTPLDPAPELGRLRERAAVTRVTLWDGSTPWLVTRHAEVRAVLADPRFSSDPKRPGYPARSAAGKARGEGEGRRSLLTMDDPDHARYRRMLTGEFTVRRIESLRPLVTTTVTDLLDALADGPRPADLVTTFALPLPSIVICWQLGVPYADHAFFEEQSRAMLNTTADPADAAGASRELGQYLSELVGWKTKHPDDDLISRLIERRVATGELTRREVVGTAMLLLIAGHETTANMVALGTLLLLANPDRAAELRANNDPAVASAAVEELLRLLTVTHLGRRRVATEDVVVGGVPIRAGDGVIAAAELANRDPEVFEHPDELDLSRPANHHVAFGFGIHQCLGQPLARLELQIAYPALLRRFPGLRVAADPADLRFREEMPVYGVDALPVTW